MTNAVLAYGNFYQSGTVTASTASGDKQNAYDNLLNDYWQPDSGASHTLDIDMGSATAVDVFGFYSSDFYSFTGAACKLYYSDDDITYTLAGTITPTTIGPKMLLVTSSSHRYWRLQFDTTAAQQPKIQHAFIGVQMEMQRGISINYAPLALASENAPVNSESASGLFIGRSVRKAPIRSVINFKNVTSAWMRTNWPVILSALESEPFLLLPSPDNYTDEAAFCWTSGLIGTPVHTEPGLLNFSLPIKARIT